MALYPFKERLLSPEAYQREMQEHRANIEAVRFIPPRLGDTHFGMFSVRYKRPILLED